MTGPQPNRWLLSRQARRDLSEIWRYIADESGDDRADRVLDRLRTRFLSLADYPLSGRARNDLREGWRSTVVNPFLVYYRPVPNGVRILRVRHGRRDEDRLQAHP